MVLGNRTSHPGRDLLLEQGDVDPLDAMPYADPFPPGHDHLLFGWNREDDVGPRGADGRAFAHPLAERADLLYRFRAGDTIAVTFPDGRRVPAVALLFTPLRADAFLPTGTLWIDPGSGVLLRAVVPAQRGNGPGARRRRSPARGTRGSRRASCAGVFKPVTLRFNSVFVDYAAVAVRATGCRTAPASRPWRPPACSRASSRPTSRTKSSRSPARPTIPPPPLRTPMPPTSSFVAAVLAQAGAGYEPATASVPRDKDTRFIVPADRHALETSPALPPPLRADAPGFATAREAEDLEATLARVPVASYSRTPWAFRYGWGSPEMIRYNRVEGLAAGLEFDAVLGGPHSVLTSASFGLADGKVKARVGLERSTERRRLTLGGFHELRAADAEAGHFGFGNSFAALVTGRDEGEYYRATGLDLTWRTPAGERESFVLRAYAERQEAVETRAGFAFLQAFDDEWSFAANLVADEVDEAGAEVTLRSWWGEAPDRAQAGVEWYGQVARNRPLEGDGALASFFRSGVVARARIPFAGDEWTGWRVGVEAAGGGTWGRSPAQRAWFLGSAATLRGYDPSVMRGPRFVRGRVELARVFEGVGGQRVLRRGVGGGGGRLRARLTCCRRPGWGSPCWTGCCAPTSPTG